MATAVVQNRRKKEKKRVPELPSNFSSRLHRTTFCKGDPLTTRSLLADCQFSKLCVCTLAPHEFCDGDGDEGRDAAAADADADADADAAAADDDDDLVDDDDADDDDLESGTTCILAPRTP